VKLLYKPFAMLCGLIAGAVSRRIARALWRLVDDEAPPTPTTEPAAWSKVLGAAAIEGLAFSVTRAAVDRAGARGFERIFGVWPGERVTSESDSPAA
jgi:pectin methylesterase-like acyl-CoA thioesterase